MKLLIHDTDPRRLTNWVVQLDRPGRECHIARSDVEAREMLRLGVYDLVCLHPATDGLSREAMKQSALKANPACRVVDLPRHSLPGQPIEQSVGPSLAEAGQHGPTATRREPVRPAAKAAKWHRTAPFGDSLARQDHVVETAIRQRALLAQRPATSRPAMDGKTGRRAVNQASSASETGVSPPAGFGHGRLDPLSVAMRAFGASSRARDRSRASPVPRSNKSHGQPRLGT